MDTTGTAWRLERCIYALVRYGGLEDLRGRTCIMLITFKAFNLLKLQSNGVVLSTFFHTLFTFPLHSRHLFWIMSHDLNLHPHIVLPQPRDTHTRPDWRMIRHPLLELACHDTQRFIVQRHMITVHPIHLRPSFTACVFQTQIDVCEGLLDLCIDGGVVYAGLRVPATLEANFSLGTSRE